MAWASIAFAVIAIGAFWWSMGGDPAKDRKQSVSFGLFCLSWSVLFLAATQT